MYYIVRRIARFKNAWESSPALKLKLKPFDFLMVSKVENILEQGVDKFLPSSIFVKIQIKGVKITLQSIDIYCNHKKQIHQ